MIETVTLTEPEFSPDDVAVLLASRRAERAPRNSLGILLSDATNPANASSFAVGAETPDPDSPWGPVTDYSVAALQRIKDGYYGAYPEAKGDASHLWPVWLRT